MLAVELSVQEYIETLADLGDRGTLELEFTVIVQGNEEGVFKFREVAGSITKVILNRYL